MAELVVPLAGGDEPIERDACSLLRSGIAEEALLMMERREDAE
jgi:hypothetical protein